MKKTTYICDSCGGEITSVVYKLTCYAKDVGGGSLGGMSSEVIVQNTRQNMAHETRHLCGACKDKITDGMFIL